MSNLAFKDIWLTQVIQEKEVSAGPLEDTAIMTSLRAETSELDSKIARRAFLLAKREGILTLVQQWGQATKIAVVLLFLLAVISGIGLAVGALDMQRQHVNILLAWFALLGLHFLTFFLWLVLMLWRRPSVLGKSWLWLSQKIARGPYAPLVAQAFVKTCQQQKALPWIAGVISHGFWLLVLSVATLYCLFLLAGKQFSFAWETTILSPDTFVALTHFLGAVPAVLGFDLPNTELITQSSNQVASLPDAQRIWSAWLTGQVVVWGIMLRLLAFLGCFIQARLALGRLFIDIHHPVYASVIKRLNPSSERLPIDAEAPAYQLPQIEQAGAGLPTDIGQRLVFGLELSPRQKWPPFAWHMSVTDLGRIESRQERHALLQRLSQYPVAEVLIFCDAQQTPDRGLAYFIRDISQYAQQTKIYLLSLDENAERRSLWEKTLSDMGLDKEHIFYHPQQVDTWVNPL